MTFSLLTSKVKRVAVLRSPPEKIFDLFANKAYDIPTLAPDLIQSVDVHGDVGTYNYTVEGKAQVFVAKMELDEANSTIIYNAIGGEVTKTYKDYKDTFEFDLKGNGSVFLLTVEVEKRNLLDPPPFRLADFLKDLVTTCDAALCLKYYC